MKETISRKAYKQVINEVEMMKRITHPNIIQMYDSFFDHQYDTAALRKKMDQDKEKQTARQPQGFEESFSASPDPGKKIKLSS